MKKAQINLGEWLQAIEEVYGLPPPNGWISATHFAKANNPELNNSTARNQLKRLVKLKRAESKFFRSPNGRLSEYFRLK